MAIMLGRMDEIQKEYETRRRTMVKMFVLAAAILTAIAMCIV